MIKRLSVDKERLDKLLVIRNLVKTCSEAEKLILAGEVYVNGEKVNKSSKPISKNSKIEIKESLPYVSRGGIKLEKALNHFNIQVKNRICLDVGASTGGFTDCLLKYGAKLVYALDVGYGQLDWSLRNNPQVVNIEKRNIRYFGRRELTQIIEPEFSRISQTLNLPRIDAGRLTGQAPYTLHDLLPDLATVDVSFISLEKVLPKVNECLKEEAEIITLVKPQFEAEIEKVKKGIVGDEKIREEVVEKIRKFMQNLGWQIYGVVLSPLKGPKGNVEYLIAGKRGDF